MTPEELREQSKDLARYGKKFTKGVELALAGGVKASIFLPSGRVLYSATGTLGDEFMDPERPFCSCSNFFFQVLGGRDDTCYHLLGYKIASRANLVEQVKFNDAEYDSYLRAFVMDVFNVVGRSSG